MMQSARHWGCSNWSDDVGIMLDTIWGICCVTIAILRHNQPSVETRLAQHWDVTGMTPCCNQYCDKGRKKSMDVTLIIDRKCVSERCLQLHTSCCLDSGQRPKERLPRKGGGHGLELSNGWRRPELGSFLWALRRSTRSARTSGGPKIRASNDAVRGRWDSFGQ